MLAFAFLERVQALLGALAHAERNYLGAQFRQTDYEIINAEKINPTQLTLSPVPTARNYDPAAALDWSFEQIERVASGAPVDDRVDEGLARAFAKIVPKEHHTGATAIWVSLDKTVINFDQSFRVRSEAIASMRKAMATKTQWATVTASGSVVGELLKVDDFDGKSEFAIKPVVGPERIVCVYPESRREEMHQFLFKTVRVHGLLHYESESPHPVKVDMHHVEEVRPLSQENHLLNMRGLFAGRARVSDEVEEIFRGL
ncbi:hypothetical protein [Methylorubrum podarium]|uniref:hypothetical protein n=1 Tax=Methylorubrum podarium TaxID=200476 RepID=UPI001EE33A4A|nr:hypothetical protein [Methylorubrum podarium]